MNRLSLLLLVLAIGCGREVATSEPEANPGEATASAASSAAARWVPLHAAKDASMLSAPCVVRAQADAAGEVSTTFRVQVKTVHVQVGDVVKKGQAVVDVSSPEVVAAAAAYLGHSGRLKVHRERLQALQQLRKEGMVRTSAVFEQEALVSELGANMRGALAVLRMAGLGPKDAGRVAQSTRVTLVAPVAGVVASIDGRPGEVLDGSASFARIVGPAHARIEVASPAALVLGETLTMLSSDGKRYELVPTPISSTTAADTGMHRTWFALADASVQLGDGLRCTIEWTLSDNVWQAPAGAVATTAEGSMVWRRRGGIVQRIVVQVLRSSGASVLVHGALQPGDEVSADGAAAIGSAQ